MSMWNILNYKNSPMNLNVTLWPAFEHFEKFSQDERLAGLRLNSAMMHASEIDEQFKKRVENSKIPCWFDIKGMQLRIKEVLHNKDHLEFIINRPVGVPTPTEVLFKAGEDSGTVTEIKNGVHFIFKDLENCPYYEVKEGESIHIRHPQLKVGGPVFLDYEKEKIAKTIACGIDRYYLSYVYDWNHVHEFRELIGKDADLILKIENKAGLDWVSNSWYGAPNTNLAAARGDLYVEVDMPHKIMKAVKLIIDNDPHAYVGSRMLLSMINQSVPRCADLSDLAWLYDIGYRNFLLCDELCLKDDLLSGAVNVFDSFRKEYQ